MTDPSQDMPHPRETDRLFGQGAAEAVFLDAYASGRLHHGWLLTGPRGIGKATLAWRIARFLLATPSGGGGLFAAPAEPVSLDIPVDHPVACRIAAGAEPGIACVTRSLNEAGTLRREIVVDDVRALTRFFGLSATDGGRRVVIVDAADEMNVNAANALLKVLEEPPERATLLLVAHQPARLLPTIRSRCRTLRLERLGPADFRSALAQAGVDEDAPGLFALADGSVGAAMHLLRDEGLSIYGALVEVLGSLPRLDREQAIALAESCAARGQAARFDLLITLLDIALARLARQGATGRSPEPEAVPGEAEIFARLAPGPVQARIWAEAAGDISARMRHGQAVNLDPAALVLDTVFKLQQIAAA